MHISIGKYHILAKTMAKRKRPEIEESEVVTKSRKDRKDRKKRKLANGTTITRPSSKAPTAGQSSNTNATPSVANIAEANSIDIRSLSPQPPAGLSAGQRKRWRRKQRRVQLFGDDGQPDPRPSAQHAPQSVPAVSSSEKKGSKGIDRSTLLRLATTKLLPWRARIWKDDGHEDEQTKPKALKEASPHPSKVTKRSQKSTQKGAPLIVQPDPRPVTVAKPHSSRSGPTSASHPTHQTSDLQSEAARAKPYRILRLPPPAVTTTSVQMSAYSNKPTSVPSHPETSDPVAAFKRFQELVNGGKSDDSDESESSESEAEDDAHPLPQLINPAVQLQRVQGASKLDKCTAVEATIPSKPGSAYSDSDNKFAANAQLVATQHMQQMTTLDDTSAVDATKPDDAHSASESSSLVSSESESEDGGVPVIEDLDANGVEDTIQQATNDEMDASTTSEVNHADANGTIGNDVSAQRDMLNVVPHHTSSNDSSPSNVDSSSTGSESDNEAADNERPLQSALVGDDDAASTRLEVRAQPPNIDDSPDTDQEIENDAGLPTISSSRHLRITSNTNAAWPANVGIKRQSSFLGLEAGGTQSATGLDPPAANDAVPASDPFDVSEADAKAALLALDEVSEGMLTVTRPIPQKFGMSLDSDDVEGAKGLINMDYSDRRGNPDLVAKFGCPKGARMEHLLWPTSVVCNMAQIPEDQGDTPTLENLYPQSAASRSSMSSNIIVATRHSAAMRSKSSSSLSELSRTPSPPSPMKHSQEPPVVAEGERTVAEHLTSLNIATTPSPSPAKKRKMTGTTSKHFTPQKRTRRKAAPAVTEEVVRTPHVLVNDSEETETCGDSSARAQNALKSMFRAESAIKALRTSRGSSIATHSDSEPSLHSSHLGADTSEYEASTQSIEPPSASPVPPPASAPPVTKRKWKSTGKKSTYFTPTKPPLDPSIIDRVDFYNTTSSGRKTRVPAGTSTAPIPSIHEPFFGIIQEKLWREPFWLLIAVTFLNKTTGRAAVPVFWKLKEKYGTPEGLAEADEEELKGLITHLGLQKQRSKRCIKIAKAWVERPPEKGTRWRTLHYPCKEDGRSLKRKKAVEEDAEAIEGLMEIGHIPGCGPYAWDSWRMFCRDVLRRVADDYNGEGAEIREDGEEFVPEWKRVLPLDKELRATLRWMWLREGWIWDHTTGERREATEEEMTKAEKGEMEINDPKERKFAERAAGAEV